MASTEPNFYDVLGVAKDATSEEIKKRFRKLARECHPDVAGGSPAAVDRFTRIRNAYETLVDPERRAHYDNPRRSYIGGRFYRDTWRPPGGLHFEGLHNPKKAQTPKPDRNRSKPSNKMTLDDLFNGFDNSDRESSTRSEGPSSDDFLKSTVSFRTVGTDVVADVDVPADIAKKGGSVMLAYTHTVRDDQGGIHEYDDLTEVRVGPGTRDGEEVVVPKRGNAGDIGTPYGDLICVIHIVDGEPKSTVQPQTRSNDGEVELVIGVTEALLGGRMVVESLGGSSPVTIPAGTSSGTRLRLKGKGANGGDAFAVVKIVVPKKLDDESRQLIERFAELNPGAPS